MRQEQTSREGWERAKGRKECALCCCRWNSRACEAPIAFGNVENAGDLSKSYLSKLMGVKAILRWVYKVLE